MSQVWVEFEMGLSWVKFESTNEIIIECTSAQSSIKMDIFSKLWQILGNKESAVNLPVQG